MVISEPWNTFYCKSCESMPEIPDESIALAVTSPPYWNAIDYGSHVADARENYRRRQDEDYEAYLNTLQTCFGEVLRTLKPGGFCAVVIGTVLMDGQHTPLPHHLTSRMEETGFRFHEEIIWYKVTGGVKRARVTIQNPAPGYYYPNLMTEHILVFRKEGGKIYENRTPEEKEESQWPVDDEFKREIANNIWHIAPVPPGQYPHPCPFPEEIPWRLIRLYSYRGEAVLDPFCGIGTTVKVADALGRRWVGYETQEEYIRAARDRIGEPLKLRDVLLCGFSKQKRDDGVAAGILSNLTSEGGA